MDQPLVSVVIPAYNGGKTLKKCLNSVLCQSYSHIQVIVVNDGKPTPDDTGVLLEELMPPGITACWRFTNRTPGCLRHGTMPGPLRGRLRAVCRL